MLIRTRLRGQPPLSTVLRIASREGCDLGPLDPGDDQDRLTLTSYVWADQIERLARLRAACDLAPAVSAPVQRAAAGEWVEAQLGEPAPDAVTVVFHSIVMQYLSDAERQRLEEALQAANGPLAWLRMEPAGDLTSCA